MSFAPAPGLDAALPRPGRRRSGSLRWLVLAPVLAFIALACWAVSSPVGSSPDEDFHLTSIWCAGGNQPGTCETTGNPARRVVPEALVESACFAHKPSVSGACQAGIDFDPSDTVVTDRGSFLHNYPPVFYATMHVFVSSKIGLSVVIMRLVNALYFVGVATLLWFLLPRRLKSTLVWQWVITMVPLGLFLIPSVNPSSWAITGIGASWIALYGFFQSEGKKKLGLGVVYSLTTFLAAGARGDAAIFEILTAAVVCFLAFRPKRRFAWEAVLPIVLAAVALMFYLTSQQSGVITTGLPEDTAGGTVPLPAKPSALSILVNNLLNSPSLVIGVFGSWELGWLDTALPVVVWAFGSLVFAGVSFGALRSSDWRKIVSVAGVALVVWLLPVYILQRSLSIVGTQVQARYILPLIVLLGGLLLLQTGTRAWMLTGLQRTVVVGALSVSQAVSLHYNFKRYVSGVGSGGGLDLDNKAQWWWGIPVGPMAIWVIGAIAFAVMLAIIARELQQYDEVLPRRRKQEPLPNLT
ncbi:DUF2142 domain-containing protein [Microbacterium sp. STN6]|uniref:DUF2142 domain-containing protein n=1 Tax=Microbacterium sp. STN6 TaxID=2995588 RepID=UPI002260D258|nr:DUF2142 domain-containing protein [Microbacterium sp. STN6]MCX7521032.1 DUF2142 domain-containing protein [Microbacterium sp. STN6]